MIKRKREPSLPDRRLARAFQFSAADLSANRNGRLSPAQQWGISPALARFLDRLMAWIPAVDAPDWLFRRGRVATLCGRARLEYKQTQVMSHFRIDFYERHYVSFDSMMRFSLTAEQYRALSEGVVYQVYYDPDVPHILSIERPLVDCEERREEHGNESGAAPGV